MASFEYFDHTADVGMRVDADDMAALLKAGAQGLTNLLVPDPDSVRVEQWREVELENQDPAYLFFDWLDELLHLFEEDGFIGKEFRTSVVGEHRLHAKIGGESFDPDRHPSGNEVKAVTYHGLVVEKSDQGWHAEVIFDI